MVHDESKYIFIQRVQSTSPDEQEVKDGSQEGTYVGGPGDTQT